MFITVKKELMLRDFKEAGCSLEDVIESRLTFTCLRLDGVFLDLRPSVLLPIRPTTAVYFCII